MISIDFDYDIDDVVKTPFGDSGIVEMLGYDAAGCQYHVKTKNNSQWYKESQLNTAQGEGAIAHFSEEDTCS